MVEETVLMAFERGDVRGTLVVVVPRLLSLFRELLGQVPAMPVENEG